MSKRNMVMVQARMDKDFTQEYVANRIGVSRVQYNRYENNETIPPADKGIKIAEVLNVTLDELYRGVRR